MAGRWQFLYTVLIAICSGEKRRLLVHLLLLLKLDVMLGVSTNVTGAWSFEKLESFVFVGQQVLAQILIDGWAAGSRRRHQGLCPQIRHGKRWA